MNCTAEKTTIEGVEVVRLVDQPRKMEVRIAPALGNNAYELTLEGKHFFFSPTRSIGELLKTRPNTVGNPFLAPWANRLDQEGFYANGKYYPLNVGLKNFRRDQFNQPMHGFLAQVPWQVASLRSGDAGAEVTSRIEPWRNPDWMTHFPFAHSFEMTYRLAGGMLEVETLIENHSTQPMPVSLAFHTYYQLTDSARDDWTLHLAGRQQVVLSDKLLPTGELRPSPYPSPCPLKGRQLDDVFLDLDRRPDGRVEFKLTGGKTQSLRAIFGPKYLCAVVFAPPGRDFVCFEPMAGPTNVFNLSHAGKYSGLQHVPAGGAWRESFWVEPKL